jgi:hypothetical protein
MIVPLDRQTVDALRRLALAERRQPSEQARVLIERCLAATVQAADGATGPPATAGRPQ